MTKVYQTIIDKGHGNCMQAAIASLFDMKLEDVPNFIEFESWFGPLWNFLQTKGYEYNGYLYNHKHETLYNPCDECLKKPDWNKHMKMTPKKLYKEQGINGYFYASVLSPKYFNWKDGQNIRHAVVIDKDYNIVHDPNSEYQNIRAYPLTSLLGYNGIVNILLINPKT